MRYLRMLTNAIAGGVLGAAYLAVLILQLNPQVPIASMTVVRWFVVLVAFYGLYLSAALFLLFLAREVVASRPFSPAWFSVRLLAWAGAAGAGLAAAVTWANLRGFHAVLGEGAAERMRQGATATTVFALVLLSIAVLRYSFGRRGSRPTGVLLVAAMLLSVLVPLLLRGPGELPVPAARRSAPSPQAAAGRVPHVAALLVDGASLGFIRQRVASGQLPNFARLLSHGASIDLATLKPTQAVPVWTAAATGKYPPRTGIRSNAVYRIRGNDPDPVDLLPDYCFASALSYQGFVREDRLTSGAVRARPVWDILADYALTSGIVGWPLTFPAHADRGYVISDYFDEAASSPLRVSDAEAGAPTSAVEIAREVFDDWQTRPWQQVLPAVSAGDSQPEGLLRARWDRAYSDAADELSLQFAPVFTAIRYEGIETFGHLFLRDAEPERFGELRAPDPRRSMLDRYYGYIDAEVGRAVGRLAPGDLLLVVSGFGMEPETLPKRLLARLIDQPEQSGTHESAPDGFLIAYGTNVARGQFPRGAIVDLAPTILYYMGVPVGRDMDGFARADLFLRSYTLEHPIAYKATHER